MTKVKPQNYSQLDFLINNFYEIIEFKRGRGIYGDRVILKRNKNAEHIFKDPDRLVEFYYMDANPVKELPKTLQIKVENIVRFITSPEHMNVICDFDANCQPEDWAIETKKAFEQVRIGDPDMFEKLNSILEERYKLLDGKFLSKLYKHKEKQYFLAKGMDLVPNEFAEEQTNSMR